MKKVRFNVLNSLGQLLAKGFTYTDNNNTRDWLEHKFDWRSYHKDAASVQYLTEETA